MTDYLDKCRNGLVPFARAVYPGFQDYWHIRKLAAILEKVERGELSRVMIQFPPRHGKPCGDNELVLTNNGQYKSLKNIVVGDQVISHTGIAREVKQVFIQGQLPCYKIITDLGQEIIAAHDHPFLTTNGWKTVEQLKIQDILAIPAKIQCTPTATETISEFIMAGYFTGDGSVGRYGKQQNTGFTNFDPDIVNDFIYHAEAAGWKIKQGKRGYYRVNNGYNDIRTWLQSKKIAGTSYTKTVPEWIFRGTNEQIAAFLGAYFNCDGHLNKRSSVREDCCLEFYSVSKQLLIDVQNLLIRLGIKSRLRIKNGRYKGQQHKSWRLSITSQTEAAKAKIILRILGDKANRLKQWYIPKQEFESPYLTVPIESIEFIGNRPCRCLEIDVDHTFLVNNIVVHNSLIASQIFPAWFAGRNPSQKVILVAGTHDLASEFGYNCRNILQDDAYKLIFPDAEVKQDSRSRTRFHFGKNGYAYFMGREGQITGRGAHLFIIDDLTKSAADADSDAGKKEVRNWYKQNAYNRLEKGGRIVLIGTRWREDDIQGWLLDPEEQEKIEDWTIFRFPAIAEEDEDFRKAGEALCPDLVPLEQLLLNQELDRRAFAGIFQQRPSIEEGNIIQRQWLKVERVNKELLKPPRILALDTAFKEKTSNDYSAATIGQRYDIRHIACLYAEQKRLDFPKLIDWTMHLVKTWDIQGIVIEDAASGASLIQTLRKLTPVPVIPMKIQRGMDKESRVHAITPFMESGGIIFDRWVPASTQEELFHNLLSFPNGVHDDLADSFTHLITYLLRYTHSMKKLSGGMRTGYLPSIYNR